MAFKRHFIGVNTIIEAQLAADSRSRRRPLGRSKARPWLLLIPLLLWFAVPPLSGAAQSDVRDEVLNTTEKIRALSPEEADMGLPVKLRAKVTYHDHEKQNIFLEDETGGVFASMLTSPPQIQRGTVVTVTGKSKSGLVTHSIKDAELEPAGVLRPLTSRRLSLSEFQSGMHDTLSVTIEADVLDAFKAGGILMMSLPSDGPPCEIWMSSPPDDFNPDAFTGSYVRATGICSVAKRANGQLERTILFCNLAGDIEILAAALGRESKATPLGRQAWARKHDNEPQIVEVMGSVSRLLPQNGLVLSDDGVEVAVLSKRPHRAAVGDQVAVSGSLLRDSHSNTVANAEIQVLGHYTTADAQGRTNHLVPMVHSARTVLKMTPELAAKGFPVRIRGVMTYYDPEAGWMFLQDQSSGIFIQPRMPDFTIRQGDNIEVTGHTLAGLYDPIVEPDQLSRIGRGILPRPVKGSITRMLTGELACLRAETSGLVRSIHVYDELIFFSMASEGKKFVAFTRLKDTNNIPYHLIGSEVRITGVCGTKANEKRQAVGFNIFVHSMSDIVVVRESPGDPYAVGTEQMSRIMGSYGAASSARRVKVEGVVTYSAKDGSLYLQDDSGGIYAQNSSGKTPNPGETIELLGFPAVGEISPVLEDATFRVSTNTLAVAPGKVTYAQAASRDWNATLVTIEGKVLDSGRLSEGTSITLETPEGIFNARLDVGDFKSFNPPRQQSRITVTGVCKTIANAEQAPAGFRILLRSPRDIVVLSGPPLASGRNAAYALVTLGVLAGGVSFWSVVLRRQVRQKTEELRRRLLNEEKIAKLHRNLLATANDIIFMLDAKGGITSINRAGELAFQLDESALLGKRLSDLLTPDHLARYQSWMETSDRHGPDRVIELDFVTGRKNLLTLEVSLIKWSEGDDSGYQGIARDITSRLQLEAQFRQAQKMETVGQLAGGVAHDFNNLLTVIQGYAKLLQSDPRLDAGAKSSLDHVLTASDRAANLTRQLLAFSRKQVMKPQPTDLNSVVRRIESMLHPLLREEIQVRLELHEGGLTVNADGAMLEQVILNLATNARDAMSSGGTFTLSTSLITLDQQSASRHPEGKRGRFALLKVADTGHGMDQATSEKVFEPFFTTKAVGKGTGLGLSTVYGIVQQHKGWIEVASAPGKGTVLSIYLPIVQARVESAPATPSVAKSGNGKGSTILLVEDEDALRRLAQTILTRAGHKVLAARDAHEAIGIWEKERDQVDLLFTDIRMPGGMDGIELAERLKTDRKELRVVYTSGYSAESHRNQSQLKEKENFLPKPWSVGDFTEILSRQLAN